MLLTICCISSFLVTRGFSDHYCDFRGIDTSVDNQGECGACWDYSVLNNLELNRMICNNVNEKLSSSYVFDCIPFGNCSGGNTLYTFEWIHKNNGVCPKNEYKFKSINQNDQKECLSCLSPLVADYESLLCFANENEQQMSMVAGYLSVQFSFSLFFCFLLFCFICVSRV